MMGWIWSFDQPSSGFENPHRRRRPGRGSGAGPPNDGPDLARKRASRRDLEAQAAGADDGPDPRELVRDHAQLDLRIEVTKYSDGTRIPCGSRLLSNRINVKLFATGNRV
jgi:hypothetical protein